MPIETCISELQTVSGRMERGLSVLHRNRDQKKLMPVGNNDDLGMRSKHCLYTGICVYAGTQKQEAAVNSKIIGLS